MKQEQLITYIQKFHPSMEEDEVRTYLNDASRELCERTGILEGIAEFITVSGQRWYDLSSLPMEVIDILDVYLANNRILKLSGTPDVFDGT